MNPPEYVLGSDDVEIARLQTQAAIIAEPTALIFERAGIRPGMRVLDLGSGPGDVAFQVAHMVGPGGSVVGVERDPAQLATAERRLAASGLHNVAFRQGDARTFTDDEPFDAVVCRLLLMHLPDAVDVLAHQIGNLGPGGLFVAVDFDMGGVRTHPEAPLFTRLRDWVKAGFVFAQADPHAGLRLPAMLAEAGFAQVQAFGLQSYWQPDDDRALTYLMGVVRAMKDAIVGSGAATESDIGLDTLEQRLRDELVAANAVWTLPTVVGGWGKRPG